MTQDGTPSRRGFLKMLGLGGAVAAASPLSATTPKDEKKSCLCGGRLDVKQGYRIYHSEKRCYTMRWIGAKAEKDKGAK